jgi:hypothetical protein
MLMRVQAALALAGVLQAAAFSFTPLAARPKLQRRNSALRNTPPAGGVPGLYSPAPPSVYEGNVTSVHGKYVFIKEDLYTVFMLIRTIVLLSAVCVSSYFCRRKGRSG